MPSPIAHAAMGYLLYEAYRSHMPEESSRYVGPIPRLLIVTVGLSMLADLDFLPGILLGDPSRFHNSFTNSATICLAVALAVGTAAWLGSRSGFKRWFTLALFSYGLHVLMDYFTIGRGVMLAWPFFLDRFDPPVKLFYGLHRSEGLMSAKHLLTLVTELGFVGLIAFILLLLRRLGLTSNTITVAKNQKPESRGTTDTRTL